MPEEKTNGEVEIKQPENPRKLVIPKNNESLSVVEARTTKGREAGKMVFFVEDSVPAKTLISFFGEENVASILRKQIRSASIEIAEDNTDDETGLFDEQKFIVDMSNLEVAGEPMSDLKDKLAEYGRELKSINPATNQEQFIAMAVKIRDIQAQIDKKSKKRKKEETTAVAA